MRLTVLGSGTFLPDDQRHSPAHLVETEDATLLLDCGFGTVHGFDRHRIAWRGITHVALTHFHMDHVGDLAPLLFALRHSVGPTREEPLVVLGPPKMEGFMARLADAHGSFVTDPGFPLEIVELVGNADWADPQGRFLLRAHPTPHTEMSLAYRVESGLESLGYTGDTGPSEELAHFLKGVALLVAECSLPDPPALLTHLSPRSLADMAGRISPDLLVVSHLYPPLRPHSLPRLLKEAGYTREMVVALDGMRVNVSGGRAALESP